MSTTTRDSRRNHQFDLLRIAFAVMVLLAHAPEITDGDRSREILTRLTSSSFTFGSLGVDGFFLLSGYLIVKSWVSRPSLGDFSVKRFLRIGPGYAVAGIVATIVVGLVAPGNPHFFHFDHTRFAIAKSLLFICKPFSPYVFPGNHYPVLNGSLWTILYEFRCYVFVALWGIAGLFKRPKLWLGLTGVLVLFLLHIDFAWRLPWSKLQFDLLGAPDRLIRLAAVFFVGGCFFLFEKKIKFRPLMAAGCACAIIATRFLCPSVIEAASVVFGGYLLFYFGSRSVPSLAWMARVPDLSYGIYLYGWPVESLLVWRFHTSPWIVFAESTVLCAGLAWLSWTFVEGPALALKRKTKAHREIPAQVTEAVTSHLVSI